MSESQQGPEIVTSLVESAIAQAIILRTLMRQADVFTRARASTLRRITRPRDPFLESSAN